MDYKEEALEIFRKFVIKYNGWSENEYTLNYTVEKIKKDTFNTQWFAPKESAIFCVNKILETTNKREYYVDVLNEIKSF